MNINKIRFDHAPKETFHIDDEPKFKSQVWTYVAYCSRNILTKIGKSTNHLDRIRSLEVDFGPLVLVKVFKGDIEKELHNTYKDYSASIGREWFSLSKSQLNSL